MPDQHAAATEHELFTTIAEPLGELPDDPLAAASVQFPIALRGYDRIAVDAYVESTAQLVAELQASRSPEVAVRRALERVGEEISGILQRAHDTADEITARSRSEAEDRLESARREASELTAAAERQVKDLDAETERIWAERHSIVTDAEGLARRLTELAESALERFPAAAVPPPPPAVPPVPAHLFDGAVEESEPPPPFAEDEPTVEQSPADHAALEPTVEQITADHVALEPTVNEHPAEQAPIPDRSIVDEPTVDMPPIEPWEGDPGPFEVGEG